MTVELVWAAGDHVGNRLGDAVNLQHGSRSSRVIQTSDTAHPIVKLKKNNSNRESSHCKEATTVCLVPGITSDTTSDISSTCDVLAHVAGRRDCQPRPSSQ